MNSSELLIDLGHLCHNVEVLKAAAHGRALFPVIKANAYGLGAVPIAKHLEKHFSAQSLPLFCVARWEELRLLRNSGVKRACLLLSETHSQELYERLGPEDHLVFSDLKDLELFARCGGSQQRPLRAHLEINTGMNRLGISPQLFEGSSLSSLLDLLEHCRRRGLEWVGLMSHLACAEQEPSRFSTHQLKLMEKCVAQVKMGWRSSLGAFPTWIHLNNSEGVSHGLEAEFLTAVRPGLHLWGLQEDSSVSKPPYLLKAVASVRGRIRQIHELKTGDAVGYGLAFRCSSGTKVATVNLGYADGLPRAAAESGLGLFVDGKKCPFVGRISMDLCSVNLDGLKTAEPSPWAYWICAEQTLEKVATALGTISYELQCALGERLTRVFKGGHLHV